GQRCHVPVLRAGHDGEQPPAGRRLPDLPTGIRRPGVTRGRPAGGQLAGGHRQAARIPRAVRPEPRHHPDGVRRDAAKGASCCDRTPRHRSRASGTPRGRRPRRTAGMTAAASASADAAGPEPALRVVVVNGSPSEQSKTMGLVDVVLDTLAKLLTIESSRIDVYRLGTGFTGAVEREDVTAEVEAELRLAEQADLLIAATPVFRGSYPGMFKHFFDLVDQYALANKPVLLAATGGGEHHALMLEHALRPLFGFFQ